MYQRRAWAGALAAGLSLALGCAEAIEAGRPQVTFVEFGSPNCIPCRKMQPVMKKVGETYAGQVKVVSHDVWTRQGEPYGRQYGIAGIPTQVFLDSNGREYARHLGFIDFAEVEKILRAGGVT